MTPNGAISQVEVKGITFFRINPVLGQRLTHTLAQNGTGWLGCTWKAAFKVSRRIPETPLNKRSTISFVDELESVRVSSAACLSRSIKTLRPCDQRHRSDKAAWRCGAL